MNALESSPKQIRTISINNAPPVLPVNSPPDSWVQICENLKNKSEFGKPVGSLMAARFETQEVEVKPVEEQIYGGFYSRNDQNILQDFQTVDWPKRAELILQFEDQRLKQLGRRLVSFYAPKTDDRSDKERIDVKSLPPGHYTMRITSDGYQQHHPLIIK